jgi:hypothetical protein
MDTPSRPGKVIPLNILQSALLLYPESLVAERLSGDARHI